ncbi:hypothetical protein [Acetobacter ghanensis]|uniref:hypothetical protein n=1 Tax=Acetobacter ghanensis TaxID=431306 RepID=UPI001E42B196|nr:hypothetical protein [Acetobacter ghanensis]
MSRVAVWAAGVSVLLVFVVVFATFLDVALGGMGLFTAKGVGGAIFPVVADLRNITPSRYRQRAHRVGVDGRFFRISGSWLLLLPA